MGNKNLSKAKETKNDEFYTQYPDIQKEINAYLEYNPDVFRNKTVLLPCDDPEWSNFTKFFAQNFENFGLKKLISTSFAIESKKYKTDWQPTLFETENPLFNLDKSKRCGKIFVLDHDTNANGKIDIGDLQWQYLEGDGDFRSDEVKRLRDEADIIVTNPPFSLFPDFLMWIMEANKLFLIIGNKNCITYKEVFPLIKENKIWVGITPMSEDILFDIPKSVADTFIKSGKNGSNYKIVDGKIFGRSTSVWITNIDHGRRHRPLSLMTMADNIKFNKEKRFVESQYPKYETIDGIDVASTNAIPRDYKGIMGVPKSFLSSHSVEQFEIIGYEREDENISVGMKNMPESFLNKYREQGGRGHYTKGMKMLCFYNNNGMAKIPFSRILIRYTKQWMESHPEDFK